MGYKFATNINFVYFINIPRWDCREKDLVDPITTHKGLTVCKYKESNLGPVTGFRALIIIIAKRLVHVRDVEFE